MANLMTMLACHGWGVTAMLVLWGVSQASGCGRVGFQAADAASRDAGGADAPAADAAPDAAAADGGPIDGGSEDSGAAPDGGLLGPFGSPTLVARLSDPVADDDDPTLTSDMLEIYFDSDRGSPGRGDVWMSRRTSLTDPWDPPWNVTELNTSSDESAPEVSGDGLTIYVASDRPSAIGGRDIYVSTRSSRAFVWGTPERVAELSSSAGDEAAVVSADGLTVYFGSDRLGSSDLFVAVRASAGAAWGAPTVMTGLSTADGETAPFISRDGLHLLFQSDRPGGAGGKDIWIASITVPMEAFVDPTPVVEVNSPVTDSDPWLSDDRRTLYFSSYRAGGDQNIFVVTR